MQLSCSLVNKPSPKLELNFSGLSRAQKKSGHVNASQILTNKGYVSIPRYIIMIVIRCVEEATEEDGGPGWATSPIFRRDPR